MPFAIHMSYITRSANAARFGLCRVAARFLDKQTVTFRPLFRLGLQPLLHSTTDYFMSSSAPGPSTGGSNLAPAHTLIARHPRTSMTHASLSSPTETHAAAAGIFPRPQAARSTSPTWQDDLAGPGAATPGHLRQPSRSLSLSDLEEMEFAPPSGDGESDDGGSEPIEVDPTFRKDAQWPGTVKIIVEATVFWYSITLRDDAH